MAKVNGLPGVKTTRTATPRRVLRSLDGAEFMAGGAIINGSKSRDFGNTGDLDVLRAGLLMGRLTADAKYAPVLVGVLQSSYTSGATEITVSAAQAVEIVRRVGSTGTLKVTGPPAAAGTVATIEKAYSAINTSTGVITIADIGANMIAGAFVTANDGSETPRTILTDQWGLKVTDEDSLSVDIPFADVLIKGQIDSSQVVDWPTDTSLIAWVKAQLRAVGIGFVFDDDFVC